MNDCETCIHYPPSSMDAKPCSQCDTNDKYLNCWQGNEVYQEGYHDGWNAAMYWLAKKAIDAVELDEEEGEG